MPTHRDPRPNVPKPPSTDNPDRGHRPHVALLLELSAYGWRVTEIRPDRTEPRLWRVTITRYDGYASITLTEADPDDALQELARYACVDAEELRIPIVFVLDEHDPEEP